jgi:hypothetical protein
MKCPFGDILIRISLPTTSCRSSPSRLVSPLQHRIHRRPLSEQQHQESDKRDGNEDPDRPSEIRHPHQRDQQQQPTRDRKDVFGSSGTEKGGHLLRLSFFPHAREPEMPVGWGGRIRTCECRHQKPRAANRRPQKATADQ